MPLRYLITGASGFIGGHVAEACGTRGEAISAILRPTSDRALLDRMGATLYKGDLTDEAILRQAVGQADVIVNCAAHVGDSGALEEYRPINVDGLRRLLEACKGQQVRRFVHMSTLGVYETRDHHGTDEKELLPEQHLDAYTQTKVEADRLALEYQRKDGVPVVVLRPGFVYGPRDRTVLPRILERLAAGRFNYLGGDQSILNCVYVGNVVDAVFLAVEKPGAVGHAYNLTDGERITKQRFIDAICDGMGYTKPRQVLPRWLIGIVTGMIGRQIKRRGINGPGWLTHAQYKFLLLNLDFSIEKARRELGYGPRVSFDQGMRHTMAWYQQKS
jgi:nucleoside-diphosphate-sugar epimerase